ncbi:putative Disease resistance protein (TIR-NBS-LRR class) [Melia azedarach]|uniref:Disease resistance protein (TIR-NBS-LRR class) n=1 Tax=Melia azedarach TaxID=155640 RepID=A0ACC1YE02_MELAZ|nr:putative Disease resistance protein (TIR-NBS-LRR class) [Melia azedarach]
MASSFSSSSSSSSSPLFSNKIVQKKYDVFLSFRGVDTRNNFTSHLYSAFSQKNIKTFIDDKLIRGDEISPSLLNAIKESEISVVIFSEGYASSRWCLKELVKILKCKKRGGQIVIPIFYHVNPSDVRNQIGNFGVSFSKLEERFKDKAQKLQRWRNALREAANLSGFDSHVIRSESVLIQEIVEVILKRLNDAFPIELDKDLVGVESHIKDIELLLSYGSKGVYTLGIWGIGGIGKTTIARAIFNKFSNYFDGVCFLQNVREECEKNGGLPQLQRVLFSTLLRDENLKIDISNMRYLFRRLSRMKVLITFDDVTYPDQIESLVYRLDWFMPGSLMIITTRYKQVLQNCGVKSIYEMKELENIHALKLFSWYAFKQDCPNVGYEELSNKVMQYAQGIPLSLKVLGRFLFGKSKGEWDSEIKKLKRIPHKHIQKVLKISFDDLDDKIQNIFLDIACFFKGIDRDFAIQFFDACGFYAEIGIRVLVDKCLITIIDNKITMHDLLQEMGREIVRQESVDDPGKRSRLYHAEEILEVLMYNTGTKAVQGISLDMSKVEQISFNFNNLKRMQNLRFLKFYEENKCKISNFSDKGYIFPKLRCLHWHGYPLKSLPIHAENLVSLELCNSKVEQLWDGLQNLLNLKEMHLNGSKQLAKLPDLSKAQNLEKLLLYGCSNLVEIHSSIQYLNKLFILNISFCKSLKRLPRSIRSKSLAYLYVPGCSNLKSFPEILSYNLKWLDLSGTSIEELPSSIGCQSRPDRLNLENCSRLKSLSNSFCKLKSLEDLNLSGCSNLQVLPDKLGNLHGLRNLYLSDCGITELPESLGHLFSLKTLCLMKNYFERIPESIINLSKLERLYLCYCERLQSLPNLPCNLQYMDASHCTSLEVLSCLSVFKLTRLYKYIAESYHLSNSYKFDGEQYDAANFIFPGSEIAEWFKYQSMGSSVTVKLQAAVDWCVFISELVGYAFCIILALDKHHYRDERLFLWYEMQVKTEDGDWHYAFSDLVIFGVGTFGFWTSVFVDSEHVFLGYKLFSCFPSYILGKFGYINEFSVQFYLKKDLAGQGLDYCKGVRKCGINLFYAQDLKE